MTIKERISLFSNLGQQLKTINSVSHPDLFEKAYVGNRWFTSDNVARALHNIASMLEPAELEQWASRYNLTRDVPKMVGIIMAGNIPLVGFHDLLSVLISGNFAAIKASSSDTVLVKFLLDQLQKTDPRISRNFDLREQLKEVDAIIATGSDNSARNFEYYFGKYPNIIRKNRTSVGVLQGNETDDQLVRLGNDVFDYFGLGCRNVSKLFVPKGYNFQALLDIWQSFGHVLDNTKYKNNYDYNKSILLVNRTPHLDTGFSLMQESEQLVSPISVTYYQEFTELAELSKLIEKDESKIQCIISKDEVPFGTGQQPKLWDYADNVDTMAFLTSLK